MKSKSRRSQLVAACAAVAALVVATGAGAAGSTRADPVPTTEPRTTSSSSVTSSPMQASRVVFRHHVARYNVLCSADHFGMDDPIVYPGQPGMSHMHTFYGNTSTDAYSTVHSLAAASPSSCGRGMGASDLSAYWVPSLMKKKADGTSSVVKRDLHATVYYRRAGGGMGPGVQPFPRGLRMIAGDHMATSDQPQRLSIVQWTCGGGGPKRTHILACPAGPSTALHASLFFPSCWDGVHLDSKDHQSHMAYATRKGTCPASHPVSLPQVNIQLDFPGVYGGPDYYLASGGRYSLHGDFIALWRNRVQNALVASCLNIPHECADMNRDGHVLFRPSYDPQPIQIDLRDFRSTSPYYASCSALHKDFSRGVARGPKAAAKQVRQGYRLPAYGQYARQIYGANYVSLDDDRDGTACERLVPTTDPLPRQVPRH